MTYTADIKNYPGISIKKTLKVKDWASLEPYFKDLATRNIDSAASLELWMKDMKRTGRSSKRRCLLAPDKNDCDTEIRVEEAFNYL